MTSSTNHKSRLHQMEDEIARDHDGELLGEKEQTLLKIKKQKASRITINEFRQRNRSQADIAHTLFDDD